MKQLVAFELRKILIVRVWVAMAACLAIAAVYFTDHYPSGMNSILAVEKKKPELVAAHIGPVQADLAGKYAFRLKEEYAETSIGTDEEKLYRILEQKYASAAYRADLFNKSLTQLSQKKMQLEPQKAEAPYLYNDAAKKLSMMEKVDPPGFYVTRDWEQLFLFISGSPGPGPLFIGFVIALALAPLYSGEAGYRMDALILSSRHGRRRIVAAKLTAGWLFTAGWVTVFYGICALLSCLPFRFIGWNAPLNSHYLFDETPYALNQLQGFLLQYLIALTAASAFFLLTALISAAFKSSMSSLGLALTMVVIPLISFPGLLGKMMLLFPAKVMWSRSLIDQYMSYNLFNTPVLYLPMALIVMAVLAAIVMPLIPKAFERRLKV
ncbi:ABC transporter permease [Paenibacillus contaminans]|uniref:Uncharacterized protein n=1 Tax=Paenibacillus contaminans TaxID=450362 RepID=A0A329MNS7_9BACL|nr:ABC transporter permease [Paenibacillus contaminans]RAV21138.1 hypothetical protein DQG23_10755 [Paenibacillus contaminans]